MNKVMLTGRLVSDKFIETTYGDKKQLLKFILAVKNPFGKDDDFVQVTIFDKHAKNFKTYVGVGDLLEIEGRLRVSNYQKNGEYISKTEVIGETVIYSVKPKQADKTTNSAINEAKETIDEEQALNEANKNYEIED